MFDSPRIRRLKSDLSALEALAAESSVFDFRPSGTPPQLYILGFRGKSLAREKSKVVVRDYHQVEIKLGASYPRTMPELRWMTPIYHPNISEIGMVCLGAYGTHWVPSLQLDELCVMLWDMARYQNYDIRSPYNREAALWSANQTAFRFPIDQRPLRDIRASAGRVEGKSGSSSGEVALPAKSNDDELILLDEVTDSSTSGERVVVATSKPEPTPAPPSPRPRPIDDVVFID
jgi:ubiquitin-protein ligase